MAFIAKTQDTNTLAKYRGALINAGKEPDIAEALASIGYDGETLREGHDLMDKTQEAFLVYQLKKKKLEAIRDQYISKKEDLEKLFDLHRAKARLVYRNDSEKYSELSLSGMMPRIKSKWLEAVRIFYTVILKDETILEDLAKAKLTREDIERGMEAIVQLEMAEAKHMHARGDSQSATEAKDRAFKVINNWMKGFYDAAKICLNGDLQRLESVGKVVKSQV